MKTTIHPTMRRLAITMALVATTLTAAADDGPARQAMRRATQYMMDVASYNGGFVWNYLPDYSRQWGELEARRTMVWLQSPSTPDMGQVLLDAYHATGDEYYYESAKCVALCIMQGQLPCGGWNYMFDLEPEDSLKAWYATVGRQAWRLEEFQHHYGNATFDDKATKHCAEFLLRIYLEKHDPTFRIPLDKAIRFFLDSQYPNGGWPQRYPIMTSHPFRGMPDYTPYITLNDDVMTENIDFLMQCYNSLGMEELQKPILKAMHLLRDLQQKPPYAGWADQYTPDDLKPAHARSYEPRAVNTATTIAMIHTMMEYYTLTGDKSFLEGIPQAITFLESQQLPASLAQSVRRLPLQEGEILMPRFVNPDNGKPLYVHRKGTNVANGTYYTDDNPDATIAHYNSFATANIPSLKEALQLTRMKVTKDLERNSPLLKAKTSGPKETWFDGASNRGWGRQSVDDIIKALGENGYWSSPLRQVSNPYLPIPKEMEGESDDRAYNQTMVGDRYDTSPYDNQVVMGISTRTYIQNMATLIHSIKPHTTTRSGLDPQRFASTVEGKATGLYVLTSNGMEACVTNYGARLVSLMTPDKNDKLQDVVLGFDNIDDYHQYKQNFGSIVGRYAGRIKDARFTLNGKQYDLQKNGANISHGGYPGLADKVWDVVEHNDSTLKLKVVSPDGENGFPGNLTVQVTYQISHDHALTINYEATTDKPTVVNLTNHTFFNISGNPEKPVTDQQLYVDAKYIATYDKNKNLDGNFMKVRNTPFDFLTPKAIGTDIDIFDEQMKITKGYDHSFVLRHPGNEKKPAAILYDSQSGRELRVYTTEPVVQVYTANGLNGLLKGKGETAYQKRTAVCLETMHLADSPNHPEFPSTTLNPGETYRSKTIFQFIGKTHKDRNLVKSILMYGTAASLTGLGVVGIVSLTK